MAGPSPPGPARLPSATARGGRFPASARRSARPGLRDQVLPASQRPIGMDGARLIFQERAGDPQLKVLRPAFGFARPSPLLGIEQGVEQAGLRQTLPRLGKAGTHGGRRGLGNSATTSAICQASGSLSGTSCRQQAPQPLRQEMASPCCSLQALAAPTTPSVSDCTMGKSVRSGVGAAGTLRRAQLPVGATEVDGRGDDVASRGAFRRHEQLPPGRGRRRKGKSEPGPLTRPRFALGS